MERVVFVKCRLSRGSFPTEAAFRLEAPFGGEYLGAVPLHYCYTPDRANIPPGKLSESEIEGRVVALVVGASPDAGNVIRVQLPDGDVYEVSRDEIESSEGQRRVPLKS